MKFCSIILNLISFIIMWSSNWLSTRGCYQVNAHILLYFIFKQHILIYITNGVEKKIHTIWSFDSPNLNFLLISIFQFKLSHFMHNLVFFFWEIYENSHFSVVVLKKATLNRNVQHWCSVKKCDNFILTGWRKIVENIT